jgi:signal transduction histidine kinase
MLAYRRLAEAGLMIEFLAPMQLLSLVLLLLGIGLAFSEIRLAGWVVAWILLSGVLLLQGFRSILSYFAGHGGVDPATYNAANEWMGLGFSLLIVASMYMTREVFSKHRLLAEADRVKTEFMANVTHELRTPLNSVIGFAGLLKDEVPGPLNAKQAEFAADILASGQRLLALVEGILEMSRLDVAGGALGREPVEIGAALEERVAAHRQVAGARGLTMRLEVAADAGRPELDSRALRRMLDALIDNAIKFNREGGTVTVSAQRDDGWLQIAVADTGIGIAREDLPRLFKSLAQLDAGMSRQRGGIGLGLALARRLAELHGGTLEVESEPGKGSRFTLRLPILEKS